MYVLLATKRRQYCVHSTTISVTASSTRKRAKTPAAPSQLGEEHHVCSCKPHFINGCCKVAEVGVLGGQGEG
jgi:hypothetical protein